MLCFGSLLELFTLCRSLQQAKLLTDFPFLCRVHMDNHRSAKHTRQNLHDGVLDSYIFGVIPTTVREGLVVRSINFWLNGLIFREI